jgi:hypothetical protein
VTRSTVTIPSVYHSIFGSPVTAVVAAWQCHLLHLDQIWVPRLLPPCVNILGETGSSKRYLTADYRPRPIIHWITAIVVASQTVSIVCVPERSLSAIRIFLHSLALFIFLRRPLATTTHNDQPNEAGIFSATRTDTYTVYAFCTRHTTTLKRLFDHRLTPTLEIWFVSASVSELRCASFVVSVLIVRYLF